MQAHDTRRSGAGRPDTFTATSGLGQLLACSATSRRRNAGRQQLVEGTLNHQWNTSSITSKTGSQFTNRSAISESLRWWYLARAHRTVRSMRRGTVHMRHEKTGQSNRLVPRAPALPPGVPRKRMMANVVETWGAPISHGPGGSADRRGRPRLKRNGNPRAFDTRVMDSAASGVPGVQTAGHWLDPRNIGSPAPAPQCTAGVEPNQIPSGQSARGHLREEQLESRRCAATPAPGPLNCSHSGVDLSSLSSLGGHHGDWSNFATVHDGRH